MGLIIEESKKEGGEGWAQKRGRHLTPKGMGWDGINSCDRSGSTRHDMDGTGVCNMAKQGGYSRYRATSRLGRARSNIEVKGWEVWVHRYYDVRQRDVLRMLASVCREERLPRLGITTSGKPG